MMKKTKGEIAFQFADVFFLLIVFCAILFPLMYVLSVSVSSSAALRAGKVTIFPQGFNLGAYREILKNQAFLRSLVNTVGITVVGTVLAVLVTAMAGCALTLDCYGKKCITYFLVLTMYFSGGLVPTYIVYSRYLGLRNTYWVLFLPSLFSMFYAIVIRSQIESMPKSVFEAAYVDGANEFRTLFSVTLPMIAPTIAAVSMFFALAKWNMWYNVMIYASSEKYWTLQYFLRVVVFDKFLAANDSTQFIDSADAIPEENYRMAAIVLAAAPIVAIYPFVQKYFVKGIVSGAVKG